MRTVTDENNGERIRIYESDAGIKEIIKRTNAEKIRLRKEHGNLNRNDKCFCGSGLKYKNCCYSKEN